MESIYTFTNSPILVTDLDGTILTNGKVSREISNIFDKIYDLGIPITFATGRSKIPASKFSKLLKLKLPYICSGGSIISDPETGIDIYQKEIDMGTFIDIINDVNEFKNLRDSVNLEYKLRGNSLVIDLIPKNIGISTAWRWAKNKIKKNILIL